LVVVYGIEYEILLALYEGLVDLTFEEITGYGFYFTDELLYYCCGFYSLLEVIVDI
jgi:hypothetical protein